MHAHHKAADSAFFSSTQSSAGTAKAPSTGVLGFVGRLIGAVRSARAARSTYDQLSQLSDRELADIGLHRADLPQLLADRQLGPR